MKIGRLMVCTFMLTTLSSVRLAANELDGVSAIVNDEIVTFSDVRQAATPGEQKLKAEGYERKELVDKIRAHRIKTLHDLIDRRLVIQAFDQEITSDPKLQAEIMRATETNMKLIIRLQYKDNPESFVHAIKENGLSIREFIRGIEEQAIYQAMLTRYVDDRVPKHDAAAREKRQREWLEELRERTFVKMF